MMALVFAFRLPIDKVKIFGRSSSRRYAPSPSAKASSYLSNALSLSSIWPSHAVSPTIALNPQMALFSGNGNLYTASTALVSVFVKCCLTFTFADLPVITPFTSTPFNGMATDSLVNNPQSALFISCSLLHNRYGNFDKLIQLLA